MATSRAMSLEDSVEATVSNLRAQAPEWKANPFTIFRVPYYDRQRDRTAYEPRMVSIGPYYHGDDALRAMEEHKWRYLHGFLSRNSALSSRTLVEEIRSLAARAHACYSERPELDLDDFVRMLLLDGCFIIEFFFKWHEEEPDALCDVGWGIRLITADLLLLENQIPFFVIETLYGLVGGAQASRESLLDLLLLYISNETEPKYTIPSGDINHLLHLYHEAFVPVRSPGALPTKTRPTRVLPRAAEMSAAGVSFVLRSQAPDVYAVAFDRRRGVMEIPPVVIDGMKRPLLVNLMAFEQTQGAHEAGAVTSYVWLMSTLVRTAEDVVLLRERNILDNLLANDEEAASFFSHLGEGGAMNYDQLVFADLHKNVLRYCDSWRNKNMARLRRDYFSNPWSAIAFLVATLIFVLTATQTYFTVFPRK